MSASAEERARSCVANTWAKAHCDVRGRIAYRDDELVGGARECNDASIQAAAPARQASATTFRASWHTMSRRPFIERATGCGMSITPVFPTRAYSNMSLRCHVMIDGNMRR